MIGKEYNRILIKDKWIGGGAPINEMRNGCMSWWCVYTSQYIDRAYNVGVYIQRHLNQPANMACKWIHNFFAVVCPIKRTNEPMDERMNEQTNKNDDDGGGGDLKQTNDGKIASIARTRRHYCETHYNDHAPWKKRQMSLGLRHHAYARPPMSIESIIRHT